MSINGRDQLQNHLPYSTSSISPWFCVYGEYFRTIPICSCHILDKTNNSAEQISAVRRGFDGAITYATLCKNLRRSRDFARITINFFFNFAFWISRRVRRMTRRGAARREGSTNLLSPRRRFVHGRIRKYRKGEIAGHNEPLGVPIYASGHLVRSAIRASPVSPVLFVFRICIDIRQPDKSTLFERFIPRVKGRRETGFLRYAHKNSSSAFFYWTNGDCLRHWKDFEVSSREEIRGCKNLQITE